MPLLRLCPSPPFPPLSSSALTRQVTVEKAKLILVDRAGEAGGASGLGGGFGAMGGALPMGGLPGQRGFGMPTPVRDDGFRTPSRDFANYPSTPMRDAVPMTPMRDGELSADPTRTPSRSDPWDPTKTPAHDPWSAAASRTPSHSVAWEQPQSDVGSHVQTDDFAPLHLAPQWPPPRPPYARAPSRALLPPPMSVACSEAQLAEEGTGQAQGGNCGVVCCLAVPAPASSAPCPRARPALLCLRPSLLRPRS